MLTVILKGTNACNLRCKYCSLGSKEDWHVITQETLMQSLTYLGRLCAHRGESQLTLLLHGGEPMLIPPQVYAQAIDAMRLQFPALTLSISMQTNCYELTDEYIAFFQKYDVHVGVSLDGGAEIHDQQRLNVTGEGTFHQVQRNILRLQAADVPVSCLMVLTSLGINGDLSYLDFFEEHGISLKINPLLNYGEVYKNGFLALEHGQYAAYLIAVYAHCITEGHSALPSPLNKFLQGILTQQPLSECTFRPQCNSHFLCIDYNGTLYPCGKFSDLGAYTIGTVRDEPQALAQQSTFQTVCNRRECQLPETCKHCKYHRFCNGGCTAEVAIEGDLAGVPWLCEDYRTLFAYFHGDGLQLFKKHLLLEKEALEQQRTECIHGL